MALTSLLSDWIDRQTLQETLGLSKTSAWRLLRRCGAAPGPGHALACRREDLVAALDHITQDPAFQQETRRRARLENSLLELAHLAHARLTPVASGPRGAELASARLASLPAGVSLSPVRLTIDFTGLPDLLEKLAALAFACQNDYEAIRKFVEEQSGA
jgi:hypothetical protein